MGLVTPSNRAHEYRGLTAFILSAPTEYVTGPIPCPIQPNQGPGRRDPAAAPHFDCELPAISEGMAAVQGARASPVTAPPRAQPTAARKPMYEVRGRAGCQGVAGPRVLEGWGGGGEVSHQCQPGTHQKHLACRSCLAWPDDGVASASLLRVAHWRRPGERGAGDQRLRCRGRIATRPSPPAATAGPPRECVGAAGPHPQPAPPERPAIRRAVQVVSPAADGGCPAHCPPARPPARVRPGLLRARCRVQQQGAAIWAALSHAPRAGACALAPTLGAWRSQRASSGASGGRSPPPAPCALPLLHCRLHRFYLVVDRVVEQHRVYKVGAAGC